MSVQGQKGISIIDQLLAVAGLLHIGQLTASPVGDTRFGDLAVLDRVRVGDVLRADDAGDQQFAHLEVHPDFLATGDDQVAVGQAVHDQGRDLQVHGLLAIHGAYAVVRAGVAGAQQTCRIDRIRQEVGEIALETEQLRDVRVFRGRAVAGCGVVQFGLVLDGDDDSQDVTDLAAR